jgi:hypothetical protein
MTDLCYDDLAEQQCDEAIKLALAIDPASIDANHALANIRLSQNKPLDASELVDGVFRRIHAVRERINARTVLEELHGHEHVDEAGEWGKGSEWRVGGRNNVTAATHLSDSQTGKDMVCIYFCTEFMPPPCICIIYIIYIA